MAKKGTIPSLTLDGFINNKKIQMSKLFEYFLASDYSQSNTFYTQIKSLKYILAKSANPEEARVSIARALEGLYSSYFTTASADVILVEKEGTSQVSIHIEVKATYENETYSLIRELQYTNGDIETFNSLLDQYYEMYSGE